MPSLTGGLCLRALLLGCLTPSLSKSCRYLRSLHDSCCMPVGLPLEPDIVAASNPGHSTAPTRPPPAKHPLLSPSSLLLYAYPHPPPLSPSTSSLHLSLPPCQSRPRRGTAQHLTVPPSACSVEMWEARQRGVLPQQARDPVLYRGGGDQQGGPPLP